MGDRVWDWIQFPVRDIYLGMQPATQVNSAWPSLRYSRRNEYQPKAGVKAGIVHVWVAGRTVLFTCYTRTISDRYINLPSLLYYWKAGRNRKVNY